MSEPFVGHTGKAGLRLKEWEDAFPGLVAGFTTRSGGVSEQPYGSFNMGLHVGDSSSHVIANRKRLAEELGMTFEAWTCADQVHGSKVCEVAAGGAGRESLEDVIDETDGLFTNKRGILLTSFYADCVPLYFLDQKTGAIGLAHAGWKGTVSRIAEEMVRSFGRHYGTKAETVKVAIGPAICGRCYEVDERIIEQVRASAQNWENAVESRENGHYMLDLPTLNQEILTECGIVPENIIRTQWCTSCRTDLFFSHRREAGRTGKTGRMASFIGWRIV
ncbi:peptidoglycan editing factor PgeF [Brevibacillus borstelensis]|uniref:peptidoglycan editing factor PgeF n=1 Tax=Brevibacillus borstelensis TaxID=45462 RepID=UPI0030BA2EDD